MFDVGFSEMLVIGIVALVVIGPERLPRVARTLGFLFGRMQRYVAQVKTDIAREMEVADLGKVKAEFEDAARTFKTEVESKAAEVERDMRDAHDSIEKSLAAEPPAQAEAIEGATAAPPVANPEPAPSPQLELGIEEPPDWKPRKPSSPT